MHNFYRKVIFLVPPSAIADVEINLPSDTPWAVDATS